MHTTLQAAINAAAIGPRGVVWILPNYPGTDSYLNPSNVPIFDMRNAGSVSFGSSPLGVPNTWTQIQTFKRTAETGTALLSGNFVLTGWGTGGTITAISGYDGCHVFTITAGTTPSSSPTIQLTYSDGTWTKAPIVHALVIGGTGSASDLAVASTATTYVLTYDGLPVATKTYIVNVMVRGLA